MVFFFNLMARNAPDCTDLHLDFKIFRGSIPPDPPCVGLHLLCCASRAFGASLTASPSLPFFFSFSWLHPCYCGGKSFSVAFMGDSRLREHGNSKTHLKNVCLFFVLFFAIWWSLKIEKNVLEKCLKSA